MSRIVYENADVIWGSDSHYGVWYCVQGLYSEGTSLDEFLNNAFAVKVDQDGGDIGYVIAEELPESAIEHLKEYWIRNSNV